MSFEVNYDKKIYASSLHKIIVNKTLNICVDKLSVKNIDFKC